MQRQASPRAAEAGEDLPADRVVPVAERGAAPRSGASPTSPPRSTLYSRRRRTPREYSRYGNEREARVGRRSRTRSTPRRRRASGRGARTALAASGCAPTSSGPNGAEAASRGRTSPQGTALARRRRARAPAFSHSASVGQPLAAPSGRRRRPRTSRRAAPARRAAAARSRPKPLTRSSRRRRAAPELRVRRARPPCATPSRRRSTSAGRRSRRRRRTRAYARVGDRRRVDAERRERRPACAGRSLSYAHGSVSVPITNGPPAISTSAGASTGVRRRAAPPGPSPASGWRRRPSAGSWRASSRRAGARAARPSRTRSRPASSGSTAVEVGDSSSTSSDRVADLGDELAGAGRVEDVERRPVRGAGA